MSIVLLVGHLDVMCPLPKHLKHLMSLVPMLKAYVLGFIGDFPCGEVIVGSVEDPTFFLGMSLRFRL